MARLTIEAIRIGLASLPQELYDEIYHHVVACDVATTTKTTFRNMEKRSRMPVQLQLNRQIRREFSQVYYSNSTFCFSMNLPLLPWACVLTAEARGLVRNVRCQWSGTARISKHYRRAAREFVPSGTIYRGEGFGGGVVQYCESGETV